MKKALFIHGFGGDRNSSTGKCVAEGLKDSYEVITEDFDLTDIKGTVAKIEKIIQEEKIELLAGTSLGGFYTLLTDFAGPKLVVNPCMKPTIVIPNLEPKPDLDEGTLILWQHIEDQLYKKNASDKVTGLFGDKDELLGTKFHQLFEYCYGSKNMIFFEGKHSGGSESLVKTVKELKI